MRMHLNGKQFETVMLERYDELLEKEDNPDMTDEEAIEMDVLGIWYEAFIDYTEMCNRVDTYYREHGVEIVYD